MNFIDVTMPDRYSRAPIFFREEAVIDQGYLSTEDAIWFPKTLSASDPAAIFDFCNKIKNCDGVVVLDASEFQFIDPIGLATLRATLDARPDDHEMYCRFMSNDMLAYLIRMDFFVGLDVDGFDPEVGRNPQGEPDNCVELTEVTNAEQSEVVASRLVHAMTGIKDNPDTAEEMEPYRRPLEYALKELLENALSHAKKDGNLNASVWVACQHFKTHGSVRLAIVDNGCGFLATLKDHAMLNERTDLRAIQIALIERVSCNRGALISYDSDSQNQGVGLTTTAKIAAAADGFLVIGSGKAWMRTGDKGEGQIDDCPWKGVAIAFECNRDLLPKIDIPSLLPAVEGTLDEEINFDD